MFLKSRVSENTSLSAQLISVGGTKMEDGRTWSHSQDLMSRMIQITDTSLELGKLTHLKSFQVTSSHKNKTCTGSSTPRLMNAASCDLEPSESTSLRSILYGGQSVDSGLTSNEIVMISSGKLEEDISQSKIDVTRYPAVHEHYHEFGIPAGWPDGQHLVQLGDIPEGRTGSKLSFLRKAGSSDLLVSIGGHSKPDYFTDFYHPEDSIHILSVPEMRWFKVENSETFLRSFHSQTANSEGDLFILGGMSVKEGRWEEIHPLNQVIKIHFSQDFSFSEIRINLVAEIEIPHLTNFASCGDGNNIFIFGGFTFPKYDHTRKNLYKFQPPKTKRNKLPKLSSDLFKINLAEGKLSSCPCLEEVGAYNGSAVMLSSGNSPAEILIHADPRILLYSERIMNPPKCDLTAEFGACSLSITEKKRNSYFCPQPHCMKKIHIKCDKSLKGKCTRS